ncbi:acyltransferase [Psychroserpens sp. AS72]|uniref:acyltransferase family protein n=1 Tax=Psychroserpens sp. AS72 TaxID=3135775 RepID=UPI0031799898
MTPSNPFFALLIILITFCTGYIINLKYKLKVSPNRFETIDGLRGFLAVSVFIHHSNIWYTYVQTGNWASPDSNLFNQLGHTSVSLFFMISSFLFVKMLMDFKGENYDWKSFFVRRIFRLAPLHFCITTIIIVIVFIQSNWELNVSYTTLTKNLIQWYGFGTLGLGPINDFRATIINAGVLWSLPYEWLLYFCLPLISILILKSKPKLFYILLGVIFIIISLQFRSYRFVHLLSFLGGAIAPIILKYSKKSINYNNWWFTILLLFSMILVFQFYSSNNYICKLFIIISFTLIALGNTFFGLLKNTTLKLLGEISYSTYLIHGVLLFVTVHYIYGLEQTKLLSQTDYCLLILMMSPFLIIISFLTYLFIEKPFMARAKRITMTTIR